MTQPRVIFADVPEPIYDTYRRVFVMPKDYAQSKTAGAILTLMRERR